jgi:hypothetical protein
LPSLEKFTPMKKVQTTILSALSSTFKDSTVIAL